MADNSVFITGAAEGAFTEALNGLPQWATENTALSIEKYIRKSFDIQTKMLSQLTKTGRAAGLDPKEIEKVNNELDRLVKGIKRHNEEDAKGRKRNSDQAKADKERLKDTRELSESSRFLENALNVAGAAGLKIGQTFKQYFEANKSIYTSGINVFNANVDLKESMLFLNQAVKDTGLRLEILQKATEKYSQAINVAGFLKFSKAVGTAKDSLLSVGYYAEDIPEFIGLVLDSQLGYADMQKKSMEELVADSSRLGEQLQRLSKTTGANIRQLEENMKKTAKSGDATIVFAKYGAKAAENLGVATAALPDHLRKMITSMAAAANPAQTPEYMSMVRTGLTTQAAQLAQISKAAMSDPQMAQQMLKQFQLSNVQNSGSTANLSNLYDRGGAEVAQLMYDLKEAGDVTSGATKAQLDASMKSQSVAAKLDAENERRLAMLQAAFVPLEKQMEVLTTVIKGLNDVGYGLIDAIGTQILSYGGAVFAIYGFVAALGVANTALLSLASKIPGIGGNAGSAIGRAGIMAKGAGVLSAGMAGYQVGKHVINPMLDWGASAITGKEDTFGTALYGLFNSDKEKQIEEMLKGSTTTGPKPSTVNAPKTPASTTKAPTNDKPGSSSDINNLMSQGNSLTMQMLEGINKMVSVSNETLRYIKQQ